MWTVNVKKYQSMYLLHGCYAIIILWGSTLLSAGIIPGPRFYNCLPFTTCARVLLISEHSGLEPSSLEPSRALHFEPRALKPRAFEPLSLPFRKHWPKAGPPTTGGGAPYKRRKVGLFWVVERAWELHATRLEVIDWLTIENKINGYNKNNTEMSN